MKQLTRARRVGITAVLCALVLRLWLGDWRGRALDFLTSPRTAAFFLYLETGRDVRFSSSLPAFSPNFMESPPAATVPAETVPTLPSFSQAEEPSLYYAATVEPDIEALLTRPLTWNLRENPPSVLIIHTHTTEGYAESPGWRTTEESGNMIAIGDTVADALTAQGIGVIHDRELHDYPSYNGAYVRTRKSLEAYLRQYPGLRLILDLHRDAAGEGNRQMRTQATVAGEPSAQLMIVMGTNYDTYEENLSLGLKLHAQLERMYPGITRPLQLRAARFNQDLCPGSLLIEIGAAGNTQAEAQRAAKALAQAVTALALGTEAAQ